MKNIFKHRITKILLGMISVVILVLLPSFTYWRNWRVESIPDVGEPFDVEAYLKSYDEIEENPFDTLKGASTKYWEIIRAQNHTIANTNPWVLWEQRSVADRSYLAATDPVVDLWLTTIDLSSGYEVSPHEFNFESELPVTQDSRDISRLILIRVAHLMEEGKTSEAIELYGQYLKLSLRFRDGIMISNLVGIAEYALFWESLSIFLQHDSLTIEELQRLRAIVIEHHDKCQPVSVNLRMEYMMIYNSLHQETDSRWINSISREDEVAQRVLNLIFQNWYRYCDLPAWERPPVHEHKCNSFSLSGIWNQDTAASQCQFNYFVDEQEEQILEAYHRLASTKGTFNLALISIRQLMKAYDRDLSRRESTLTMIALAIYHREHGTFPQTLEELVPQYLEAVPLNRDVNPGWQVEPGMPISYQVEEGVAKLRFDIPFLNSDLHPPGKPSYTRPFE
ncbi:MAG: hypothetical protein R3C11_10110 [Planctomycetaceae bacterium]